MGDTAILLGFLAHESGLFFGHMQSALLHYIETKEIPQSLFTDKDVLQVNTEVQTPAPAGGSGRRKQKKEKGSRRLSAYNVYMKEKMEELKASGAQPSEEHKGDRNPRFAMAAAEWKNLSEEQKQVYAARAAAAEGGAAPTAAAAAPAAAAVPGAETSKKKRKKHHKERSEKKHKHKQQE